MDIKLALAGNPNCGKTTMFNDLTGSRQHVGNWPGVTVEKKEGALREAENVIVQDLPGIYSLSPYTLEEVVARDYLVGQRPDAILNLVDATNIERNLYLTTQLAELGIPMVIALNMIDIVRKNGDRVHLQKLSAALRCPVVETSALKGEGSLDAAKAAAKLAREGSDAPVLQVFTGEVAEAIARIEGLIAQHAEASLIRWYAVKLFEGDEKARANLTLPADVTEAIAAIVADVENRLDDDAESIITNQRYAFIQQVLKDCVHQGRPQGSLTVSDKIDRIVTHRILGLLIFAAVMFLVYDIAVSTVGALLTDFTNDVFVAEWIKEPVRVWLTDIGAASWLTGLVCDGIIAGCGAVLGFVPQMLVLFLLLAILEDCGYMARIAFIMDRVFRRFGLSGRSFIPMMIGTGCGVPGVMASRTIESDRDRKMTIMTTTFIPCSAKMPIIALIAGALFGNAGWVAASAYFIGVAAVVFSGILLKKTRLFAGEPAPFVMELPAYHLPAPVNVLRSLWERGWSFIKRAGTVILVSAVVIWFTQTYGWEAQQPEQPIDGTAVAVESAPLVFGEVEDTDHSILGRAGSVVAPVFSPLGFGDWKPTVATVLGLVAKEEVVNVFGIVYNTDTADMDTATLLEEGSDDDLSAGLQPIAAGFDETSGGHGALAAYAFMIFNLLCAPCFAAIGAIKREMNSGKWTLLAIGYQCALAYAVALIVFQLGLMVSGVFNLWTAAALLLLAGLIYLLVRPNPYDEHHLTRRIQRTKGA